MSEDPQRAERSWRARDLLVRKHLHSSLPHLISVAPADSLRHALSLMEVYNLSQLPVLEGRRQVGSLRHAALLRLGPGLRPALDRPVREVMEKPLESAEENADYAGLLGLLSDGAQAVIITREGQVQGVLTAVDLISPWLSGQAGDYSI